MTKEQILEFNKKCAIFIGAKFYNGDKETFPNGYWLLDDDDYDFDLSKYLGNMKFHSDWHLIMGVIEKIESLKYGVEIIGNYCHIIGSDIYSTKVNKKQAIIEAIDRFLTDYLNGTK